MMNLDDLSVVLKIFYKGIPLRSSLATIEVSMRKQTVQRIINACTSGVILVNTAYLYSIDEFQEPSSEIEMISPDSNEKLIVKKDKDNDKRFFSEVKKAWNTRGERKKIKEKIKHDLQQRKKEFEEYHKSNHQRLGRENWDLINNIASDAARLIEKQYDGFTSVKAGLNCLDELRGHKDLLTKKSLENDDFQSLKSSLTELRNRCHDNLTNFKKQKKAKKIKRVKNKPKYDEKDKKYHQTEGAKAVAWELLKLDNWSPEFLTYINSAISTPYINCTVKGISVTAGFIWGGKLGGQRFKCNTSLGNRAFYGLSNVGLSLGIGLHISHWKKVYARKVLEDGSSYYDEFKYKISYDSRRVKWGLFVGMNAALGWGYDATNDMNSSTSQNETKNAPNTHSLPEHVGFGVNSYGVGFNISEGLSNFFKVKDIRPDFRELFHQLGLDMDQNSILKNNENLDKEFDHTIPDLFAKNVKKHKSRKKVQESEVPQKPNLFH